MPRYNYTWSGPDTANAEFSWEAPNWWKVLEVAAKYEGELYDNTTSPLYNELQEAIPSKAWISNQNDGTFRSFFRDSAGAWTRTGVLDLSDKRFRVTPLGRFVLSGQITFTDLLLGVLIRHRERGGEKDGENPFAILADAFLKAKQPLTLKQVYLGIMQNYRPAQDDLAAALQEADTNSVAMPATPQRHLKHIIRLLENVNAISSEGNDKWIAWDHNVLQRLEGSYQTVSTLPDTLKEMVQAATRDLLGAGLLYDPNVVCRFIAALLAKPFVILTGLSGSGKTKLAQAFATWIAPKGASAIIAVGADWTNSEQILGYPNALSKTEYVKTRALKLLLEASLNPERPYFLILDEMNLSHVERYFADILSAIETKEAMYLHSDLEARDGVPASLELPTNLFIIGTVNVDETTYMFSPKVLDRANTLEFRLTSSDMDTYLHDPSSPNMMRLAELGSAYAVDFIIATHSRLTLKDEYRQKFQQEIRLFFEILQEHGAEFGFRTTGEIARFISFYDALSSNSDSYQQAIDAQILQKLLPKLHGSRRQLEPILSALAHLCYQERDWKDEEGTLELSNSTLMLEKAMQAARLEDESLHPLFKQNGIPAWPPTDKVPLRLSYEKIYRMLQRLEVNGFTSFAEA